MGKKKNATPAYPTVEEIARFWSQVEVGKPNKCWPWKGKVNGNRRDTGGYGYMPLKGRGSVGAHRLAYEIANGPSAILAHPDWVVGHLCMDFDHTLTNDNRRCCNPKHLDLVSPSDDKSRHGTSRKSPVRLKKNQIIDIFEQCLIHKKHYLDLVGPARSVTTQTLWGILRGDSHKAIRDKFLADNGLTDEQAKTILKSTRRKR